MGKWLSWPISKMKEQISAFLAEKKLSENSRRSYQYDLQQFMETVGENVTKSRLKLYEQAISSLKPAAKKRKYSAVNQFLYYLYRMDLLETFYKLDTSLTGEVEQAGFTLRSLDFTKSKTQYSDGQLLALLILELGLAPSEVLAIKKSDLDLDFQVLKVKRQEQLRVVTLPQDLLPFFDRTSGKEYFFEYQGRPYSRQWFFRQLKAFLSEQGYPDLTAQKLREQYILRQQAKGLSSFDIARQLGLKSQTSLERYFK